MRDRSPAPGYRNSRSAAKSWRAAETRLRSWNARSADTTSKSIRCGACRSDCERMRLRAQSPSSSPVTYETHAEASTTIKQLAFALLALFANDLGGGLGQPHPRPSFHALRQFLERREFRKLDSVRRARVVAGAR